MKRLGPWLKLGFSLVMVGYVLAVSNPGQILRVLADANTGLLLVGTAVWGVIQLLNVFKWQVLSRAQGVDVPFRSLLDVYYIGMFFNTFLPSGFGGDAVRAYELSRLTARGGASLSSVVMDRYTSLLSLVLLATLAIFFAPPALQVVPRSLVAVTCLAGIAGFVFLLQDRWLRRLSSHSFGAATPKVQRMLTEMADSAASLNSRKSALGLALLISLAFQFLTIVEHYLFMLALGLAVPFAYTVFFIPILTFVASLPISINGLGIREGGYAYFLGHVGVGSAEAVSVGLLSFSMLLLSGAWGAVRYMGKRREGAAPVQERPAS